LCYTIKIDLTREQIEKRFRATLQQPELFFPGERISAFALPSVPVICSENTTEIRLYKWGLIPFWVKNIESANKLRRKTFNAKAETLAEKPSFRNSLKTKRCLVVTNGFYEWQTLGKEKIPFFMGLKDEKFVALAGLYDTWTNMETGEVLNTFTVITTRANPKMEEIHNLKKRMPVILSPDNETTWLAPNLTAHDLNTTFVPYPQELMTFEKLEKPLR
jgi:putative SOS response-associated peptidase YedK